MSARRNRGAGKAGKVMTAKQLAEVNSLVDRKIRRSVEVKWLLGSTNFTTPDNSYLINPFPLVVMPSGTDIGQRIGDQINVVGIRFSWATYSPGAVLAQTNTSARLIIFRVHDNESTAPALTQQQILSVANAGTQGAITANYDGRQWRQFTVIHDETVDVGFNGSGVKTRVIDKRLQFKVTYVNTTAFPASVAKNAMYAMFLGPFAGGSGDNPSVFFDWTIKYTDA